nr:LacI family transcriptional regulator [Acetatifactor sp.]
MSIKKIAQKAGTSPATVSRVLNNPDYRCQEPELRNRILEAAMELSYAPNIAAKSLRCGTRVNETKIYYINVLVTKDEDTAPDPFLDELIRIIESEIHKTGNILHKVWSVSGFSNERRSHLANIDKVISNLHESCEGKCDGLIVVGDCCKDALVRLEMKFKNVFSVSRRNASHVVDEVVCDGKKIASQAVEYLISLGHREIGYVGECHKDSRYKGFMDTLLKHDIEPIKSYIYESRQSEAAGFEIMENIMQGEDIPTALYCANDIIAIGILKALSKKKKWNFNISV